MRRSATYMMLVVAMLSLLYSCANIGRPEGGDRDDFPPVFIKSNPDQEAVNVRPTKVELTFDELVQLKDHLKKVTVSPVQKEQPLIKTSGRSVTVEFRDTLMSDQTYCIDFSDAICDNNESNPLQGFSFAFSTGESIDTMQIAGTMLRARDLEPMQYTLVGLHNNLSDTAFTSVPLLRVARTDERGQFVFRNIKHGDYRVFGLNDLDGNYKFSRNEDLAFCDSVLHTTTEMYTSADTVFTYSREVDTVMMRQHTRYLPNDVLLTMFNEDYRPLYLKKNERVEDYKLHVLFSSRAPKMPELKILKPANHAAKWCVTEYSERYDSIYYWLTDSALIMSDSIMVEMTYAYTDSTEQISERTDTLFFNLKQSQIRKREQDKKNRAEELKRKAKEREEEAEQQNKERQRMIKKRMENGDPDIAGLDTMKIKPAGPSIFDSVPELRINAGNRTINKQDAIDLDFSMPPDTIFADKVCLSQLVDTVWVPIDTARIVPASEYDVLKYQIHHKWEYATTYRLEIDSLAVHSYYGHMNKPFKQEFKVPAEEDYSNLYLNVNVQDSAFVELLNTSDQVQRVSPVVRGTAVFEDVNPGSYYARIVLDRNGNGKWDPGNYGKREQPEEVYYYHTRLQLKRNWDIDQSWNIYDLPLDQQKPVELRKNKTEAEKKSRAKSYKEEEEEPNEFGGTGYGNPGGQMGFGNNRGSNLGTPYERRR